MEVVGLTQLGQKLVNKGREEGGYVLATTVLAGVGIVALKKNLK